VTSMLEVQQLQVVFGHGRDRLVAVDRVDLAIETGKTLGLVGESGSGKSTLGRALVGLLPANAGRIVIEGVNVTNASGRQLAKLRATVNIVFQDPASSLNPRMQVGETVEEVLGANRARTKQSKHELALEVLSMVGLDKALTNRYPHQLSGGQRQRVALARALAVQPKVLILDEVTSSLDVLVQANVLNLLRRLQSELGLTYLFITHNLSVAHYMSDSIAVMYLGRVVEHGRVDEVLNNAQHPYTQALVGAIPELGKRPLAKALGDTPNPRLPPTGCRYHPRCAVGPVVNPQRSICTERDPSFAADGSPAAVACHFAGRLANS
jgi:peptide/nickel transport system ATP-binding protein